MKLGIMLAPPENKKNKKGRAGGTDAAGGTGVFSKKLMGEKGIKGNGIEEGVHAAFLGGNINEVRAELHAFRAIPADEKGGTVFSISDMDRVGSIKFSKAKG